MIFFCIGAVIFLCLLVIGISLNARAHIYWRVLILLFSFIRLLFSSTFYTSTGGKWMRVIVRANMQVYAQYCLELLFDHLFCELKRDYDFDEIRALFIAGHA